jgi:hypothetical protein
MRTLLDSTEPLSPYPRNAKNAQPILIFETENEKMAWLKGSSGAVLQYCRRAHSFAPLCVYLSLRNFA